MQMSALRVIGAVGCFLIEWFEWHGALQHVMLEQWQNQEPEPNIRALACRTDQGRSACDYALKSISAWCPNPKEQAWLRHHGVHY